MEDMCTNYSPTAEVLLRANLGFYGSDIPGELLSYLDSLLAYAFRSLAAAGIHLTPGDLYDDELQVMYAAWLYRRGGEGTAKPPMLQQAIRNRQIEKTLSAGEETA